MADVFVSYSRKNAARVESLVRAIEAHGLEVWWDRSLELGGNFTGVISGELAKAKAVVVCWSDEARDSKWVTGEAIEADGLEKYVGALIAPGRGPPPPFNTINNANLQTWSGGADDMQFLNLLKEVGRLVQRPDISERASAVQKNLDDAEARRIAEAQAERARQAQLDAAEQARQAAEAERIRQANLDPDTFAYFQLGLKCQRFKDKESYESAGRSWRTEHGATGFWIMMAVILVSYIVWVASLDGAFFRMILFFVGTPMLLSVTWLLGSILIQPLLFQEKKAWLKYDTNSLGNEKREDWPREPGSRNTYYYRKSFFAASAPYQHMAASYYKRKDLQDVFKNRRTIWEAWEQLAPRHGELHANLRHYYDLSKPKS